MICLTCNSDHDGSFGSGKYCDRRCANSRPRSLETKKKISNSVRNGIIDGSIKRASPKGRKLRERSKEHAEKISLARKKYWDRVGRKEKTEADIQKFKKTNILRVQNYRAKKYSATPNDVDRKLIKLIYENCPSGYEVDHIIPLANGGLHHPDNFQYLPAIENRRKNKTQNYDRSLVIRWQDLLWQPIKKGGKLIPPS